MNNKIFISGRITGDPNCVEKFYQAEKRLKSSYDVVNPCYLQFWGLPLVCYSWRTCMMVCLWNLVKCSTVYMLEDWKESRGARIEHKVAKLFRKKMIYQGEGNFGPIKRIAFSKL